MARKKNKETFKVRDVVAVAFAAAEVNAFAATNENKGYLKASIPVTGYYEDKIALPKDYKGTYDNVPYVFANKELVKFYFGRDHLIRHSPRGTVVPKLVVTDEHYAQADELISSFQKNLMFDALAGRLTEFDEDIYAVVETEEVTDYELGLISCFPSLFKRKEKMAEISSNSEFIGKPGEAVTDVPIKILNAKYVEDFDCYVYNALANDKDIITFFSKKDPSDFGDECVISGKIKRTEFSKYNKANETVLNYVKVIEDVAA